MIGGMEIISRPYYNKVQKRKLLASRLEKESKLVKDDSINVLHEFEMIDYER